MTITNNTQQRGNNPDESWSSHDIAITIGWVPEYHERLDGRFTLEFRDRRTGGGVPNRPAFKYGDWFTASAIRFEDPDQLLPLMKVNL